MNTNYEAGDIDVTMAQRQAGANEEAIANFVAPRSVVSGTGALSTGNRASKPSGAALNDQYFETDTGWLYYWAGTAWKYQAGVNVGTDATRAAITVTANDNGALFFTNDQNKLWRVESGVWADKFVSLDLTTALKIAGSQIIGIRKTGWGAPTGTLSRAAYAAYGGQTVSNPPTQAEVQSLDDAVKLLSQTVTALLNDIHTSTSASSGHKLLST